jgi:hypothetical protein
MERNQVQEFQRTLVSEEFLAFCERQDREPVDFDRAKRELYFRSIGYSPKPVPEQDAELVLQDLSLGFTVKGLLRPAV